MAHDFWDEAEAEDLRKQYREEQKSWSNRLIKTAKGKTLSTLANALTALRNAPEWRNLVQYNNFTERTVIRGVPPWASKRLEQDWTDTDDILTAEWLQRNGIIVTPNVAAQAVDVVAREQRFHPVRDYFEQLSWDGTLRLDRWAVDNLGAQDTPYIGAVSSRFLISAVARVYAPGCQADAVLILEGKQNTGKSTAIRTLASPWFTDDIDVLGSKEAAMQLPGVWIVELSELASMTRGEIDRVKAFITRRTDRYRSSYGRRVVEHPRQSVFVGSINPGGAGYLRDETGARRFWPIRCGNIDIKGLEFERDQIWAEARDRYRRDEPWWLDTHELNAVAAEEQDARYQEDAWQPLIEEFVACKNTVLVGEILKEALRLPVERWGQAEQNRVARCLRKMGWERYQVRDGRRRSWQYRRIAPVSPLAE